MAWPQDARNINFTPLTPVTSAHLNEVQDRIVDLYGSREIMIPLAGAWLDHMIHGSLYYLESDGHVPARCNIPLGHFAAGAVITRVRVKYYIAGTKGMAISVYQISSEVDDAAVAPSGSYPAFHNSNTDTETAPYWRVADMSGLSLTVANGEYLELRVTTDEAGDRIGGVAVTYTP